MLYIYGNYHAYKTIYTGITRYSNRNNRTIFTNIPDQDWTYNRDYWKRIILRYQDSDGRKTICKLSSRMIKIPTGTESVENEFNLIQQNHTAKRGGLGSKRLHRIMHCVGNYTLMKNWW